MVARRKVHELAELAELPQERTAKVLSVRRVQSAVSETVVSASEGNDASFARDQDRRLQRGLNRFESGIAEDRLSFVGAVRAGRGSVLRLVPAAERDAAEFLG
jgi:hypothetical protein